MRATRRAFDLDDDPDLELQADALVTDDDLAVAASAVVDVASVDALSSLDDR